ncbi:MAG: UDP-GlcNAc:undecaprenyl-phosphate/decaprenyl-phosphate GlcNAc-phosphate transferase [Acidimicrobiia bacterium]|jgi:UDP-GlcNAc:undecaprenyl-phosphate GlcNAc-1-phosphate transferase|nr:UDP-GlcNAc:undecaprenyl-phosphate/decaprenyl-phosphate GlcNAc-phosphate transferase [Acidimicrobiia bacterium]
MLCGVLAAFVVASLMSGFDMVFSSSRATLGVLAAAVAIYGVGFIDDLIEVSAPAKLAGMVLAGSILTLAGVSIVYFRVPFSGVVVLSADLSVLVTVLWVIGMANAVNLVDGLDGLAAGIVGIAAAAFFLYTAQLADRALLRPDNPSPLIAATVVGVCVGFLPHNFHPARTFMGDGGALLLGLLMAAATSSVGGQSRAQFSGQTYFFFAPLIIPLFILGVPILDSIFAIVRRARSRSGVATADKGHLHHRLMNLGHGQRRSVLILWSWTALLSAVVLYPTITGKGDGLVLIGVLALALLLFTYFHPGVRARRRGVSVEG